MASPSLSAGTRLASSFLRLWSSWSVGGGLLELDPVVHAELVLLHGGDVQRASLANIIALVVVNVVALGVRTISHANLKKKKIKIKKKHPDGLSVRPRFGMHVTFTLAARLPEVKPWHIDCNLVATLHARRT